ncbi:MAG TPA: hypothetical protein VGI92_14605 [Gemmatimonadales bacterium]
MLAAVSCFKDPTSSLQGSATRLDLSVNFANLAVGDTQVVTIQAVDNQGNFKAFAAPTYAPAAPSVANMIAFPDTVIGTVPGNTLYKALLIGAAAGNTKVSITAAGVTDSIIVVVQ